MKTTTAIWQKSRRHSKVHPSQHIHQGHRHSHRPSYRADSTDFFFPAGKHKGRNINALSHDELRGWYHFFADKGEQPKGWVAEAMTIARALLDKDKAEAANEIPTPTDSDKPMFDPELDNIPF